MRLLRLFHDHILDIPDLVDITYQKHQKFPFKFFFATLAEMLGHEISLIKSFYKEFTSSKYLNI